MVAELADSSVNLAMRPWVKSADYWDVRAMMLEKEKPPLTLLGFRFLTRKRMCICFQRMSRLPDFLRAL